MARKMIFHIGLSRTGTTLVQHTLINSRVREDMRQRGMVYSDMTQRIWKWVLGFDDEFFKRKLAERHDALPVHDAVVNGEVRFDRPAKDAARKVIEKALEHLEDTVIVSQEGFADLYTYLSSVGREEELADFLDIFRDYFDPHLLVVVRRQDDFVESFYDYSVRVGYGEDFERFYARFPVDHLQWNATVDFFHKLASAGSPRVLPYERTLLTSLGYRNVAEAFFKNCGIDLPVDFSQLPQVNASVAQDLVPVVVQINRLLPPERAGEVANCLYANFPKQSGQKFTIMTDEQRRALLERYRESNEDLFRRFTSLPPNAYAPA